MVDWVSENEQIPGSIPEPEMLDSAGGGRIALHCLGGEGPPALFVHATGFNARTYGPFGSGLVDRITICAPDLRSHGSSTPPSHCDYEWTSHDEEFLFMVDHLEIQPR